MSRSKTLDALDMEFQYYSSLVKDLCLMLPNRCERILAGAWFRKLSEPLYNAEALRAKRNRYLLMLTISLTINSLRHPFNKYPPDDALKPVTCIQDPRRGCCTDQCLSSPSESQRCDLHDTGCPKDEYNIGKVLDEQFKFLMDLGEPYVSRLSDPADRRRGRKWITFLSSIETQCFHMKGVRNDYAMLLSGYLTNDELPGPFVQSPIQKIVPLEDLVKIEDMRNHMPIDPSHPKTLKFFRDVPHPKEGAFAFIAVSGEVCDSFVNSK